MSGLQHCVCSVSVASRARGRRGSAAERALLNARAQLFGEATPPHPSSHVAETVLVGSDEFREEAAYAEDLLHPPDPIRKSFCLSESLEVSSLTKPVSSNLLIGFLTLL